MSESMVSLEDFLMQEIVHKDCQHEVVVCEECGRKISAHQITDEIERLQAEIKRLREELNSVTTDLELSRASGIL